MKENDVKASYSDIYLATIADRLGAIMAWALGTERPGLIAPELLGEKHKSPEEETNRNVVSYDTPEEFMKERYGG